ncbi:MAG: VWA domain-containing protein [Armatimonadota bacterium]|nr:VWA domain-containing protein [Armatimonadota bacterium]MDR7519344.1 VWA domain-containing protein [Armatimonadota bacterium]
MTFKWPVMLWALGALPAALGFAAIAARHRRRAQARLADHHLYDRLVGPLRSRNRLPAVLYLSSFVLLIVAAARPIAAVPLPVNRAAVVLAVDASQSMLADDVKPTRLEATKAAARTLVGALPRGMRVGLVVFSDVGTILVPPTTDRTELFDALERLETQQSTAVGAAIVESLYVLPDRRVFLGEQLARLRNQSSPDPAQGSPGSPSPIPAPSAADLPPAAIILFSDGVTNTGVDPESAADLAREARVPIHAVGVGREGGAVTTLGGRLVLVPFDASSLRDLARRTGGDYVEIGDEGALRRIPASLGRLIGWERHPTEITAILAGLAGLLMTTGAVLSAAWFRRVP